MRLLFLWGSVIALAIVCITYAQQKADEPGSLTELMERYKPPYKRSDGPPDPAILFERVDVLIERGFPETGQTPFISVGRDGSYAYILDPIDRPQGQKRRGASLNGRLTPERLTELHQLLEATKWLTAAGGEGQPTHTDADRMTLAVTRDARRATVVMQGRRPAPYDALQKFFHDLAIQEHTYHKLRWPEERREAVRDLHGMIQSALERPSRGKLYQFIAFERYYDLFAATPDGWPASDEEELILSIDLMLLLKRVDQSPAIARLRFDRSDHVTKAVAQALPVLMGEESIPLLAEMSNDEARLSLIKLGEPAIPTIVAIIEPGMREDDHRSGRMVRVYLDHWDEIARPIDPRIIEAAALAREKSGNHAWIEYYDELREKSEHAQATKTMNEK